MKNGGFLLYIIGKWHWAIFGSSSNLKVTGSDLVTAGIMYMFLGISLATQDYINPSIDIIKKKGVVSKTRSECFLKCN